MKYGWKTFAAFIALVMVSSMFLAGCATVAPLADAAESPAEGVTYVSIDINPSIELTVVSGLVTAAKAYNDDGTAILLSADVVNMTPQDAVKALVNEFSAQGYIVAGDTSSSVVITVAGGGDDALLDSLKANAQQSLMDLGLQAQVVATTVAEEIVQTAGNCGLSVGKYLVLKQIAIQEKITLEEAIQKYGSMKMGELLKKIEDVDAFMGEIQDMSEALDSLTPQQLAILNDGTAAFQAAMKATQKAFLDARTAAKKAYQDARDAAKDAFIADKDNAKLKAAKEQIKTAFEQAKQAALDAMKKAKEEAKAAFVNAAERLGLSQELIDKLTEWHFDSEFDFEMDLDIESEHQEDVKDNENKGKGNQNQKNGQNKGDDHGDQGEDTDQD